MPLKRVDFERLCPEEGISRVRKPKAVVKKPDPDTQYPAELIQPAGGDAVRPALVFLHLLKGELQRGRELLQAHPQHGAAQPETCADIDVDRVRLADPAAGDRVGCSESAHAV